MFSYTCVLQPCDANSAKCDLVFFVLTSLLPLRYLCENLVHGAMLTKLEDTKLVSAVLERQCNTLCDSSQHVRPHRQVSLSACMSQAFVHRLRLWPAQASCFAQEAKLVLSLHPRQKYAGCSLVHVLTNMSRTLHLLLGW